MNRQKVSIYSAAILVIILLVAGFSTRILQSSYLGWGIHRLADSNILPPLSEKSFEMNVTIPGTIIQVIAASNSTLTISIMYDNSREFTWEGTDFKNNVDILNTGIYNLKINNNNTTDYSNYNATIAQEEPNIETQMPYKWLSTPLFLLGGFAAASTATICLLTKYKNRVNKGIAKTVGVIIIFVLLVFSYQIFGLILNTSHPWMVCEGTSMEPFMHTGDLAIIMGTDPQELYPGDVIVFQKVNMITSPDTLSTLSAPYAHRIKYLNAVNNASNFYTQGDNNPNLDGWSVPNQGVFGKIMLVVPRIGFLFLILNRPETKIATVPVILLLFFFLPSKKRTKKQPAPKETKENSTLPQLESSTAQALGSEGNKQLHSASEQKASMG